MSDQKLSNFIICPASAVPPKGGSKFDNSPLNDAFFESTGSFAPAGHLMLFDITPLIMLLGPFGCVKFLGVDSTGICIQKFTHKIQITEWVRNDI